MKKFELTYMMFCDYALQDNNRKVSLLGIFENINAKQFPASIASFVVAGSVKIMDVEVKKATIELEVFDPKDKPIGKNKPTISVNYIPESIGGNERKLNFLFTINAFSFPEKGKYKFKAIVNSEEVGEVILDVKQIN